MADIGRTRRGAMHPDTGGMPSVSSETPVKQPADATAAHDKAPAMSDPFAVFTEWSSAPDDKAYADL